MRRAAALVLAAILLFSAGAAENFQKAPDYIMEGYDGDLSNRNWDDNLFFTRMQERTGISFQFRQYTDYDKWQERKAELLAGEDLPDVLFKAELSSGEIRDLYAGGRIIDLAPYLREYAPDLWQLLEEHPAWKDAISMPDGAIPALPAIRTLQNNDAMWINTEWLKRVGMDAPRTAEELTEVLRAFRTKDPNNNYQQDEIPLSFIGMWELRFLGHAFGIIDNDYYVAVRDGKVTSSLTSPENRAFLAWLHQLWEEELIDRNGFSQTDSARQITEDNTTIPYGMFLSSSPLTIVPKSALQRYSLLEPLAYNGKQEYRDLFGNLTGGTFAITPACSEPGKLVAWVNFLYTQEGSRLANYGMEGDEYTTGADGLWDWNEKLETVAEEILPEHTITEGGAAPGIQDIPFQGSYSDSDTRTEIGQLQKLKELSVEPFPQVTLTAEDEARIGVIQADLSAYAEQAMACFVTGDTELTDENWEAFCRTADEKGLQEMIAIWQNYFRP